MTNIIKFKPNVDNSKQFFKWTVKIHNLVNKHNKKKIFTVPEAYTICDEYLISNKIQKIFNYLKQESKNYNISPHALIKFIDIVMYFNNNYSKKK